MFGRKVARRYGVRDYPSLTFFRGGDPEAFDGNALRSDDVVAFLTDPDALQLPDKIEVVRADALFKIIRKEEQVAVLFYDEKVNERWTSPLFPVFVKMELGFPYPCRI